MGHCLGHVRPQVAMPYDASHGFGARRQIRWEARGNHCLVSRGASQRSEPSPVTKPNEAVDNRAGDDEDEDEDKMATAVEEKHHGGSRALVASLDRSGYATPSPTKEDSLPDPAPTPLGPGSG
ncbi:hypothetical protein AK812_SmicGene9377 [Symbiodinium microadriaticum]|uniref:Uncharacterized protein n=1 Tax=Symbiodinium microadriaticum TaxID=2951 RepID=A0A1Q9EIJ1_SYMMI|nr:hypothetical protein AK812_SmicGene9377 [Symbiodinium microadriaticum]